jgi:hypothetical protein
MIFCSSVVCKCVCVCVYLVEFAVWYLLELEVSGNVARQLHLPPVSVGQQLLFVVEELLAGLRGELIVGAYVCACVCMYVCVCVYECYTHA